VIRIWLKRIGLLLAVLLVAAIGWFLLWTQDTVRPDASARAALADGANVNVLRDDWLVFQPAGSLPTTALVFYPGGKTDPVAYAPMLRRIAAAGYLVVAVPMPLNISLFAPDRALDVIDAYPDIVHWVIGGHSMGGVSAISFASRHPDNIQGLLLWASYPAPGDDLSNWPFAVTSIYGTADQFATVAEIEAGKPQLPASTQYVPITGGDHFQFGNFEAAPVNATIPREQEQEAILTASLALLARVASTPREPGVNEIATRKD
jgi:pimeloyl-ACP methyl ester carboxylesterase